MGSLWMGDLEPWMDEAFIRDTWAGLGEQVTVKLISDKLSGKSLGYCFLKFESAERAKQALTLNGSTIPGTTVSFKLNWSMLGDHAIFVGDLSPNVTDEVLLSFFQQHYPSARSAKVVVDHNTHVSKGYGFVRFDSFEEQQHALVHMQGQVLQNRPLRVSLATARHRTHSQTPSNNDPNCTTVFVGGLPSHVTEPELTALFSSFGTIVYTKIPPGKGCGFVQYIFRESAETAIKHMNGFSIGTSRLRLSWGKASHPPVAYYPPYYMYMPVMYPGMYSEVAEYPASDETLAEETAEAAPAAEPSDP
ncbi:mRNA binding post-transcriptional regulator [Gorgonomyces haynaldii]|nr:mRNA binding post-transcriptional regulator [Gorgonomyces haynaldii]